MKLLIPALCLSGVVGAAARVDVGGPRAALEPAPTDALRPLGRAVPPAWRAELATASLREVDARVSFVDPPTAAPLTPDSRAPIQLVPDVPLAQIAAPPLVPPLDLSGLYVLPGGGESEFERWFRSADGEEIVRCRERARIVLAGVPDSRLAPEERLTLERELIWLEARVHRLPPTVVAPVGVAPDSCATSADLDSRFGSWTREDAAVLLWRTQDLEARERGRLSAVYFELGLYDEIRSSIFG